MVALPGECVFFANDHSPTGAILDVDCNAGTDWLCAHPIENVFWPVGTAPYRLLVLHGVEPAWTRQAELTEPGELRWGPVQAGSVCAGADFDGSGTIDGTDLAIVLGIFGSCP